MSRKTFFVILILLFAGLLIAASLIPGGGSGDGTAAEETKKAEPVEATADPTPEPAPTPTPKPTPTAAPEGYFSDALFIGDSRTEGMRMCAELEGATYFCSVGMSVLGVMNEQASVEGIGTVSLSGLLASKSFSKVYVMLGINDIGGDLDYVSSRYKEVIDYLRQTLPDAIIYICANLHVTAGTNTYGVINNTNLDRFSELIRAFANDEDIFYLNVNECFDDASGALDPNVSPDGVHLHGDGYRQWGEWFRQNAIVK